MKIRAVTGTNGAGKGTLTEFLMKEEGFLHFSVRASLEEKLQEIGTKPTRENMINLANDIRRKFGPAHIIETLYERAINSGKDAVIESVRCLGEVKFLKERGIQIWAVDADQRLRYQRILERKSSTDQISFKKFVNQEKIEFSGKDPGEQNLQGCIQGADVIFLNNGMIEDFYDEIGLHVARFVKVEL